MPMKDHGERYYIYTRNIVSRRMCWFCDTCNATSLDIPDIDVKTPQARLLDKMDDISHIRMHNFFDLVEYILKTSMENPTYQKE